MPGTVTLNPGFAPFWVEAVRAVKHPERVIGYAVWCRTEEQGRTRIRRFLQRRGDWAVALHLANELRDKMNADYRHVVFRT